MRALDLKGLPLGDAPFAFKPDERETEADLDLPVEIRNDIARLEIIGEHSAGAVQLLDKRWRRRTVGIVTGSTADTAQPLLASTYYLTRALAPFADVRLADARLARRGGDAIPRPAPADDDPGRCRQYRRRGARPARAHGSMTAACWCASPGRGSRPPTTTSCRCKLRRGGRILGGSLSWEQAAAARAPSRAKSPFNGMAVPNDVTVSRQVLAEPDATLTDHTWATLADGTPLVTAARSGKGMIVLFHVTADTRWSDLPLSGAFVDMLKRIVALAGTTAAAERSDAAGTETRQRGGAADAACSTASARSSRRRRPRGRSRPAIPAAPPPTIRPASMGRRKASFAVNTLAPADRLAPLDFIAAQCAPRYYRTSEPQDLRGPIFLAALALLLIDALVVFWLAGGIDAADAAPRRRRRRPARGAGRRSRSCSALGGARPPRRTDGSRQFAAEGDARNPSRLCRHRRRRGRCDQQVRPCRASRCSWRSAPRLRPASRSGSISARDELAFFPLIYWPIVPGAPKPSPQALARIDAYMKQGGTVLFDTRDAVMRRPDPAAKRGAPAWWRCARSCPRSTFPSSNRCRTITC